ncbi:hypothetical protein D0962_04365 [Leptolyngbyaceae cyanobacterium CCMR0082]|uniref:Uncharacterized protein n=2 Tax=Adonisia TaxID=2950183 RepID=A0A6M0S0P3_9CYAN|nr:hypothetical protein [Adonisia turfae CCMR0082]
MEVRGQQVASTFKKTIGDTLTEVDWVSLKNLKTTGLPTIREASVVVSSTGASLAGFRINVRAHATAGWKPLFKESSDFTDPPTNSLVLGSIGTSGDDPTSLADGESVIVYLDKLGSTEGLMFEAQASSGATTTVTIEVGSDA